MTNPERVIEVQSSSGFFHQIKATPVVRLSLTGTNLTIIENDDLIMKWFDFEKCKTQLESLP